jgi:NAD(P)-dependent dehydrogenase (short-subunit alcohol dehydrogenase family)
MATLDGRVALITGAGRGIDREHALLFALEGARVVVNDIGGATDGSGTSAGPAEQVVEKIRDLGGEAVAHTEDIATWDGGRSLVRTALDAFGGLDVVVNNAGILRDRSVVNMSEEEWDAVMAVHLKAHFVTTRFAGEYWRDQAKAGSPVAASIVNTSSGAGLLGNFGQANYSAAKAGIAALTMTTAMELGRYGVRVNCIAPLARTRLTLQTPGFAELVGEPEEGGFDVWNPANISPLVAYLSTARCPFTGGVFHVGGKEVALFQGWTIQEPVLTSRDGRWTVEDLVSEGERLREGRPDIASTGTGIQELVTGFFQRHAG